MTVYVTWFVISTHVYAKPLATRTGTALAHYHRWILTSVELFCPTHNQDMKQYALSPECLATIFRCRIRSFFVGLWYRVSFGHHHRPIFSQLTWNNEQHVHSRFESKRLSPMLHAHQQESSVRLPLYVPGFHDTSVTSARCLSDDLRYLRNVYVGTMVMVYLLALLLVFTPFMFL